MTAVVVVVAAIVLGYLLKGATGFAESIPMAALGSLVLPPAEVVALVTVVEIAAGSVILPAAGVPLWERADAGRVAALAVGTLSGVVLLRVGDVGIVRALVVLVLAATAVWVLRGAITDVRADRAARSRPDLAPTAGGDTMVRERRAVEAPRLRRQAPRGPRVSAVRRVGGCLVAGLTGGVSGLDGPPLFAALTSEGASPLAVRDQVMRLLLVSAVIRLALLGLTGQLGFVLLRNAVALIPLAALGFFVGRRFSSRWRTSSTQMVSAAVCLAGVGLSVVL